jgi:hypothetical protein
MAKFITSREAQARIAELEAVVKKGTPITNAAPDPASRAKIADAVSAKLEAAKASAKASAAKLKAQTAVTAIAPKAPAATLTAESFRQSIAGPTMTRVEFQKLTQPERNTYIRNGGKLI